MSLAVMADLATKHKAFWSMCYISWEEERILQAIQKATLKVDPVFVRKHNVLYISWFDKWQVNLIANLHNELMFTTQVCRRTADHLWQVQKPTAMDLYTRFMGGVDRADLSFGTFMNCHRTTKWCSKSSFIYSNWQRWPHALFWRRYR